MARPESRVDLMHVPTPTVVTDRIARMLIVPTGKPFAAIDTCCGNGEALMNLTKSLPKCLTYGVELDEMRAAQARTKLHRVLASSAFDVTTAQSHYSLCLLNPPYDDSTMGRLEMAFLDQATRLLRIGGVLVYIIKANRYDTEVRKHLEANYDTFGYWSFPDPYYHGPELRFEQTVLIARRWGTGADLPDAVGEQHSYSYGGSYRRPVPLTGNQIDSWELPPSGSPGIFTAPEFSSVKCQEMVRNSPLHAATKIGAQRTDRPPLPLGTGHVALLLAAGAVDGVYGEGATRHLARGFVSRRVETEKIPDETAGGNAKLKVITRETFAVEIRTLEDNGKITTLSTVARPKEEEES
jgi:predicted RNA methylase